MKKRGILIVAFVFLILFIIFSSAVANSSEVAFSKISPSVKKSLQKDDSLRVIVKLKNESSSGLIFKRMKNKTDIQEEVSETIGKQKIKHKFSSINSFSAVLNKVDIEKLNNNPLVESVREEGKKYPILIDSVPLINATAVYNVRVNGINMTGKGQAVCVIDTGINFSNPSLGGCYGNNSPSSNCKVIGGYDPVYIGSEAWNIMDYEGHGTHVAGIIAANGSINGVAPEAKLLGISAYNYDNGVFYDSDIATGIYWCIDNAQTYNISVISMSLGGDTNYTSYCDSFQDEQVLVTPINDAVAKNISVVVASGNSRNYTAIASPACIENATPIGASNKDDTIASYSNRDSIVQLFAPGTSITSTCIPGDTGYSGGSCTKSGTSMATPHAAGAIAIINQYLSISSQKKTPQQIESILNLTGKQIHDSSSDLNFSRIDIYGAIIMLSDNVSPTYSNNLTSGEYRKYTNFTANITLSDNIGLASAWVEGNYTGNMTNSSIYVLSGLNSNLSKSYNISLSRASIFAYRWWFNDSNANINLSSWKYITVVNTAPVNLSLSSLNWTLNSNISLNLSQYFIDIDGDELNFTNNSASNISIYINQTSKIVTISPDYGFNGTRYIQFTANDSTNITRSDNITLNIFVPQFTWNANKFAGKTTNFSNLANFIGIQAIIDNVLNGMINFSDINFNISSIDIDNNVNISYNRVYINSSAIPLFNKSAIITLYNISWANPRILKDGEACSPSLCNIISYSSSSQILIFNVSSFSLYSTEETPIVAPQTSNNGGGGGGGGTSPTVYTATNNDMIKGYNKLLAKGDKIKFTLEENHTLNVENIIGNSSIITISSNILNFSIYSGEEKKFNLNGNYYDLYLKVNSIKNNKVNITLKNIYEAINLNNDSNTDYTKKIQEEQNEPEYSLSAYDKKVYRYVIIIVVVIIVLLMAYILIKRNSINIKTKNMGK